MNVVPPALERLINDLNRLPGIGRKTATRLALYLLRRPAVEARNLAADIAGIGFVIADRIARKLGFEANYDKEIPWEAR